MDWRPASLASLVPGIVGVALVTAYLILFLSVESQTGIAILLLGGAAALLAENLGKPSLWVIISAPWYNARSPKPGAAPGPVEIASNPGCEDAA